MMTEPDTYRPRSTIDAMRWTLMGRLTNTPSLSHWLREHGVEHWFNHDLSLSIIRPRDGRELKARPGDWIAWNGDPANFYPVRDDVFTRMYDPANRDPLDVITDELVDDVADQLEKSAKVNSWLAVWGVLVAALRAGWTPPTKGDDQ